MSSSPRIIHRMRCKFDEPYRIRLGFGLSPLRTHRETKALIDFCRGQLLEEHINLYERRKLLYEMTILAYEKPENAPFHIRWAKKGEVFWYNSVYEIIEDNCGWYWS